MRVGVYLGDFTPFDGGGYTYQNILINAINSFKCNHNFILFCSCRTEDKKHFSEDKTNRKPDRIKIIFVESNELQLNKAIYYHRIDIIWFLPFSYLKVNVPFIFTVWDLQHRVQPFFPEVSYTGFDWDSREEYYRDVLPRSMKVLTGTKVGKEEIIHFYGVHPSNIEVVPFPTPTFTNVENSLGKEYLYNKYNFQRDFLFYPAQFWPHKNHIGVLHALDFLINKYEIKIDVVFVGSDKGNEEYVKKISHELKLNSYVHFLGFVSRETMIALYQNAFALIFATFFGPDNLPPLEAFALGCPVIASKVSGAEEQMGNAAIYFNPKDSEEMAKAIKKLYELPNLRKTIILRGIERSNRRTAKDYLMDICRILDDFKPIIRCWNFEYKLP